MAKKVHGDSYDYSLVDYIGYNYKVKIKCLTCNKISTPTPHNHLRGHIQFDK